MIFRDETNPGLKHITTKLIDLDRIFRFQPLSGGYRAGLKVKWAWGYIRGQGPTIYQCTIARICTEILAY